MRANQPEDAPQREKEVHSVMFRLSCNIDELEATIQDLTSSITAVLSDMPTDNAKNQSPTTIAQTGCSLAETILKCSNRINCIRLCVVNILQRLEV